MTVHSDEPSGPRTAAEKFGFMLGLLISIPVTIIRDIARALFSAVFQLVLGITFCAAVIWLIAGFGPTLYGWLGTLPWADWCAALASLIHA